VSGLPEPSQRLPTAARAYWRLVLAGQAVPPVVLSLALVEAWEALGIPRWLPLLVVLAVAAAAIVVVPSVRWQRWRYEVRPEEIDLRHGTFTVRRTLVPIRRVQHVDTRSGAVQGSFDLATVSFHTAAGRTEIPALRRGEAEDVRRRVGELARVRDDT
jgi:uncharacterized protein